MEPAVIRLLELYERNPNLLYRLCDQAGLSDTEIKNNGNLVHFPLLTLNPRPLHTLRKIACDPVAGTDKVKNVITALSLYLPAVQKNTPSRNYKYTRLRFISNFVKSIGLDDKTLSYIRRAYTNRAYIKQLSEDTGLKRADITTVFSVFDRVFLDGVEIEEALLNPTGSGTPKSVDYIAQQAQNLTELMDCNNEVCRFLPASYIETVKIADHISKCAELYPLNSKFVKRVASDLNLEKSTLLLNITNIDLVLSLLQRVTGVKRVTGAKGKDKLDASKELIRGLTIIKVYEEMLDEYRKFLSKKKAK